MHNKSLWPAAIIFDLSGVLFEINRTIYGNLIITPIQDGIAILNDCLAQKNEYQKPLHSVYLLSNSSLAILQHIQTQFPEILNQFSGIISAEQAGFKKPDSRIFQYFLTHYKRKPGECIFIDDTPENISAAQQIGINSILFQGYNHTHNALKKLDIL